MRKIEVLQSDANEICPRLLDYVALDLLHMRYVYEIMNCKLYSLLKDRFNCLVLPVLFDLELILFHFWLQT